MVKPMQYRFAQAAQSATVTRDTHVEPPPMDESWWEAIMAEDEVKSPVLISKKSSPSPAIARPIHQYQPGEQPALDWDMALEIYQTDQTVSLCVTSFNRGGLLVSGNGLQGFVPVSHLVDAPMRGGINEADINEPEEWLSSYLELSLRLKIIECDPDRGRVVFSERAALAEPGTRNNILQGLQPGDKVSGEVTNITDFGVFVDLGGVEGLVHVSEISWGRVHHPADVVTIGQIVQVYVIQVDRERARIALSLKRLFPNPWETANERYFPGQITSAVVTSIVPFGAFARLEEGLDGLIHVTEMDCDGVHILPGDLLREGQDIQVRVLHVDGARQRLGLSLKL